MLKNNPSPSTMMPASPVIGNQLGLNGLNQLGILNQLEIESTVESTGL